MAVGQGRTGKLGRQDARQASRAAPRRAVWLAFLYVAFGCSDDLCPVLFEGGVQANGRARACLHKFLLFFNRSRDAAVLFTFQPNILRR